MAKFVKQTATTASSRHSAKGADKVSVLEGILQNFLSESDKSFHDAENWCQIAALMMEFADVRKPGEIKVSAYNPKGQSDKTIIQISCQDFSYIVDAVHAEIGRHGLGIKLSLYPEIRVVRDAKGKLQSVSSSRSSERENLEALLYIEIERCASAARLQKLEKKILWVLEKAFVVDQDANVFWGRIDDVLGYLNKNQKALSEFEVDEVSGFLEWCKQGHFLPLGYRKYKYTHEKNAILFETASGRGLGLLRDDSYVLDEERALRTGENGNDTAKFLKSRRLLVITKSTNQSAIDQHARYDRIGVREYNAAGELIGAHLFVGHFTSRAHTCSAFDIPYVRKRAEYVLEKAMYVPNSHNYRTLIQIINGYPFDELMQTQRTELLRNALRILRIQERSQTALFTRYDAYRRFVSCLIYTTKDGFTNQTQIKLEDLLTKAFNGKFESYALYIDDQPMVRIQIIINQDQDIPLKTASVAKLEQQVQDICRSWSRELSEHIRSKMDINQVIMLEDRYLHAFSLAFQEQHTAAGTLEDIASIEKLLNTEVPAVLAFTEHQAEDNESRYHLSFYHEGQPISPLRLLRIVENFGLTPISDNHYTSDIHVEDDVREVHIHDFPIQATAQQWAKLDPRQDIFEEALQAIWQNLAGNDRLNELLFLAEMNLSEVVLLRAIGRYLMQARLPYSQEYYAEMLVRHAPLMRMVVDYFHAKFDPAMQGKAKPEQALAKCEQYISQVKSIDEDRVLRRVLNVIHAMVRTNYYQRDRMGIAKPQLSFKLNSNEVLDLPKPVPLYETFVYAHRVEGIHLRSSRISRGGLRWSDRREDFRDEILDLMKAQTVKNSVIVPSGAKGGFYVKYPPVNGDRKTIQEEAIACYQIFIRGLLDITDNWVGKKLVQPKNVVCYDEEDPYLVVAADKGTATFLDIANAISKEYNHWLGDAFASGGSAGYDHKAMGITARGAWESVRHHGYHLGINVDKDPITAVGVGDMGGDVFGNGLLRTPHLKLVGAFSYSHIFCDPNPEPAKSFAERERLFNAVGNWDQYNPALLSKGGRIYSRADKEIELTPEIQEAFGIEQNKVPPAELMRAILRARVDLLWFGGIGTYVKASSELDVDVRDKANDFIRINGSELNCKIIGEGANLGMTQRGRIEAGNHGVALNTDFIDNSAGVNTSDYEVNIKILLNSQMAAGNLTLEKRNKLLGSMTDEVAELVLANNRAQNTALGVAHEMSSGRIEHFGRLIDELETLSGISRKLEALPSNADLARIASEGGGLTRAEISVILSHTKLLITHVLTKDSIVEDPALTPLLNQYFPKEIVKQYGDAILSYALKPQLLAMLLANMLVNQASVYMPKWLSDRTGLGYADITRSFIIASGLFDFPQHWNSVQALEGVSGRVQRELLIELLQHTDRTLPWFLNQNELLKDMSGTIAQYRPHYLKLSQQILSLLPPERRQARNTHELRLIAEGVPPETAATHANMRSLAAGPSIIALALDLKKPVVEVAKLYFQAGERFGFDGLREQARQSMRNEYWQRQAISALIEDFSAHQLRLTRAIITSNQSLKEWMSDQNELIVRMDALVNELRSESTTSVTQLTVANRRLRGLVPSRVDD